jgi:hypothetical protein
LFNFAERPMPIASSKCFGKASTNAFIFFILLGKSTNKKNSTGEFFVIAI